MIGKLHRRPKVSPEIVFSKSLIPHAFDKEAFIVRLQRSVHYSGGSGERPRRKDRLRSLL